jgi:hypothetical protein
MGKKIVPLAFCKLSKNIAFVKNGDRQGQQFEYFKGRLNINGTFYTTMAKYTKSGDIMLEIFNKIK